MNDYKEFADKLQFALNSDILLNYYDWKPQAIEADKWGTIFNITEDKDAAGSLTLVFRNPHTNRIHLTVPKEIDSHHIRQSVFGESSRLLMLADLLQGATETSLIDMFSFCVGEKKVRKFIEMYRSADKGEDKGDEDKTVYRG